MTEAKSSSPSTPSSSANGSSNPVVKGGGKLLKGMAKGVKQISAAVAGTAGKGATTALDHVGDAAVYTGKAVQHTAHDAAKVTAGAAKFTAGAAVKTGKAVQHTVEGAAKKTGHVVLQPIIRKHRKPKPKSIADSIRASILGSGAADQVLWPAVDPDETIQNMDIILRKRVTGVTVDQFYDLILKDGPFYQTWLENSGKETISVEQWQHAAAGDDSPTFFTSPWDQDSTEYGQRRTVTFTFTRTTHLYTGPPIASVTQRHFCELQSPDRCILHMEIQMDGIPFASCFNVQIRWVVTRLGGETRSPVLEIKIGLYVNFVEQTILAGKIRSGTTEETTKAQKSLLEAVLKECADKGGGGVMMDDGAADYDEDTDVAQVYTQGGAVNACLAFPKLVAGLFKPHRNDTVVAQKAVSCQRQLETILDMLDDVGSSIDPEAESKVESELTDVLAALTTIEKYLKDSR